jgi:hypothetical protein
VLLLDCGAQQGAPAVEVEKRRKTKRRTIRKLMTLKRMMRKREGLVAPLQSCDHPQ